GGLTFEQVGTQLARFGGTPATDNHIIGALRALPPVVKKVAVGGMAAGFLLGVDVKTAYAQTAPPSPGPSSAGPPPLSPDAKQIAQEVSRLMVYPTLEVPSHTTRPPIKEERINLYNYAPIDKPFEIEDPKSLKLEMIYLGSVEIS